MPRNTDTYVTFISFSVQEIRLANLVPPYVIQSKNSSDLTLPVIINGCGVHMNAVLLIIQYQCRRFVDDLQVICSNMDLYMSYSVTCFLQG